MHLPPPIIPAHQWRNLTPSDYQAYHLLAVACSHADRTTIPHLTDHQHQFNQASAVLQHNTVGLFSDNGELHASAWVIIDDSMHHESRAFLDLLIHPIVRDAVAGIEMYLLAWAEARTRMLAQECADRKPWVLRLDVEHQNQQLIDHYTAAGFIFVFAEDAMQRDLDQPIPSHPLPAGSHYDRWLPERASAFFAVYCQAFRERPGFPGWSEATWQQNMTGHGEFRPDLSLMVSNGSTPIGFALGAVELNQSETGHIIQMGIIPAARKNGIATALLNEMLRCFKATGLRYTTLTVNANNPQARRVYHFNGFVQVKRFTSYRKAIEA